MGGEEKEAAEREEMVKREKGASGDRDSRVSERQQSRPHSRAHPAAGGAQL